jgi:hypothetical protein
MHPVFQKLNYRRQSPIRVLNAPPTLLPVLEEMRPLTTILTTLTGAKDAPFVLAFATRKAEVDKLAPRIAKAAPGDAVIWIAYPKGTSKNYSCDFNRDNGWDQLGAQGFEPVRQVAIDADWTALRFRRAGFIKTMTRTFAMTDAGRAKAAANRKSL